MANLSVARKGELIQRLLHLLNNHPDGMKAKDALVALTNSVTLTDYEKSYYPNSNLRRFEKIVRFTSIVYVKAEWLAKHQGIWTITDTGIEALKKYADPTEFHLAARKLYKQWAQENPKGGLDTGDDESEPTDEENTAITFEQAQEQAQDAIEKYITTGLGPYEFQTLVADLLRAMDYHVPWDAPPGKDAGVDIIAYGDPLGANGPRIKVQVKRQQSTVSVADLKSFMANIGQHDVGIFVCTGGFSKDASDFARSQETKRIMLINLRQFIDLWIEHRGKLNERAKQKLPLTPIYFMTPMN